MVLKVIFILVSNLLLVLRASAQIKENFVGQRGADYIACYVNLPMSANIPLGLDSVLAKFLFHVSNTTVQEAYQGYKKHFDSILRMNKETLKKANGNSHYYKITWIGLEEGKYASCMVESRWKAKNGNLNRRTKWCILYDLKHDKWLQLKDVFTLPTLSEIDKFNGSRHQMFIRQNDSLTLQFYHNNELKEAAFPILGNTKVFNAHFLSIFDNESANRDQTINVSRLSSDVDVNIPQLSIKNNNCFAVIFANENYQEEVRVDYAHNDGEMFREYCQKVLGLPEDNIHFRTDATLNNIKAEVSWMQQVAKAYGGQVRFIVYYAGHGIPDEATKTAYLLPVDGKSTILDTGYSLVKLYEKLGTMPAECVTVFMDACFSGSKRGEGMLASARGVAIKAKQQAPQGKMVVFSAAQGDETAYPYKEKEHGLFTYYLLKKLKETKGDVTYGELSIYLQTEVKRKSIVANSKSQTPTVNPSQSIAGSWKNMKLR